LRKKNGLREKRVLQALFFTERYFSKMRETRILSCSVKL
jgi:hypothetical protein